MSLLKPTFEYTGKADQPITFRIIESGPTPEHLNSLITQISNLEQQLFSSQSQVLALSTENETLKLKINTQSKELINLSSTLQQTVQNFSEDSKSLKKKLKESEKINFNHFALIEELKQKYQEDYRLKSADLEKKIIDLQKTLNLKASQVFKLSQVLKDRENKRSSAEIMLDELEKKNNEFIEKTAKSEKTIFDLEKKVNELNKRVTLLTAEVKSNDEITLQRDQQMKKLMSKIKAQESEIQRVEEELKIKEKKIQDLLKVSKAQSSKIEVKQNRNYKVSEDPKKVLELLASKEEELNIMKDMLKSLQNKHQSPASSTSKFVNNRNLPPITASGSVKDLKKEVPKHREIFKVKTNFKIREIDTKVGKKQFNSSPNLPKSVGINKFPVNKQHSEDSPIKSSKNTEIYEETPKFGEGTGSNFPEIKVSSLENVIDEIEENGSIVGKIRILDDEEEDEFEKNQELNKVELKHNAWDINENVEENENKVDLKELEKDRDVKDIEKFEELQEKSEGNQYVETIELQVIETYTEIAKELEENKSPELETKEKPDEVPESTNVLEDSQAPVHKDSMKIEVDVPKDPEKIETEAANHKPRFSDEDREKLTFTLEDEEKLC